MSERLCVICRTGRLAAGHATFVHERADHVSVVRGVPAEVCDNCGEPYFDEAVARRLLALARQSEQLGLDVGVRQYVA